MRTLILFILLVSFGEKTFAQVDEAEFIQRMVAHKIAVEILCTEFLVRDPASKALSPKVRAMFQQRCKNHDISKVNQDVKFLERHKLSKEKSLASYLAEIYGKHVPEAQLNRGVIDTANRVDTEVARHSDMLFNPIGAERRQVDLLEHAADLAARGMQENLLPPLNGIYERGRKMMPASQYLAQSPAEIANWTEAERKEMIAISQALEKSETAKLGLIKGATGAEVERRAAVLRETSHFQKTKIARAKCFEALLLGP